MTGSSQRLRAVREASGRSLRSVAKEAGVDPGYLSRIERGLQKPSVHVLVAVSRTLGLRHVVDTLGLFVESE